MTKKVSRKEQAARTKRKLLEVSLELIQKEGFENVKITDICTAVGISTGAFYHHFKNKAGIVIEGYSQCDRYFEEQVYPRLKDRRDLAVVAEYIGYQMQYAMDFGVDAVRQMYKAQLKYGREFFVSTERALPSDLTELLRNLQKAGKLSKKKKAEELSREILVISRGILYNWCLMNASYNPKDFAKSMIDSYLDAHRN